MNRNTKIRLLKGAGYPLYALLCLLLFGYLTFPIDRLISALLEDYQNKNKVGIYYDLVETSGLSGLYFEGLKLEKDSGDEPLKLNIDQLNVSFSLISLLQGKMGLAVEAHLAGGSIEGSIEEGEPDVYKVNLIWDSLESARIAPLHNALPLPLSGKIKGEMVVDYDAKRIKKSSGLLSLSAVGAGLGAGKIAVPGNLFADGLTVQPIKLGTLSGKMKIDKGKAEVVSLSLKGPDVEAIVEGHVGLRKPLISSTAKFSMRFKFSQEFLDKNEIFKSLDMIPIMKKARQKSGTYKDYYAFSAFGKVDKLHFKAERYMPERKNEPAVPKAARAARPARRPGEPAKAMARPPMPPRPLAGEAPNGPPPGATPRPEPPAEGGDQEEAQAAPAEEAPQAPAGPEGEEVAEEPEGEDQGEEEAEGEDQGEEGAEGEDQGEEE